MFCLVASSLGHLRTQCSIVFGFSLHVATIGGGFVGASWPSGNTSHCPLVAQGHSRSVWKASLEEMASGNLFIRGLAVERQHGSLSR